MKPILFNTEMVQALLDGRKTVTRRKIDIDIVNQFDCESDGTATAFVEQSTGDSYKPADVCKFQVEDILYVRETFCKSDDGYHYRAGFKDTEGLMKAYGYKWHPSLHMPKEAARLFLNVTDVRVEKLHRLSCEDALSEGIKCAEHDDSWLIRFKNVWDSTVKNGDSNLYGWDSNPYVWVIEFERCEKPVE